MGPQNSKRSHGVKNICFVFFSCKNPTFTNDFWDLGPFWDVWCPKPNIYELFLGFWTLLGCLVSKTQHLRIIFGILDPFGMSGVRNPTFTNSFWDFGPFWGVWCQKPNIYELFLGFWTLLGCLVSEPQHLRIIFGILNLILFLPWECLGDSVKPNF